MNKQGFTLLELLVSISIVGILSTTSVVNLSLAKEKAQLVKGYQYEQSMVRQMSLGLTKYADFDEPAFCPYGSGGICFANDIAGVGTPFRVDYATRVEDDSQCVSGACYDVTGGKFIQHNVNAVGNLYPQDNSLQDIFSGGGMISLWFKPTVLSSNSMLIEHGDSEYGYTHGFFITLRNDKLEFRMVFDDGVVYWTTPAVVKANVWQHFGLIFDRLDVSTPPTITINGISQELTVAGTSVSQSYQPQYNNTRIGDGQMYGSDFNGYIDRVIISANAS